MNTNDRIHGPAAREAIESRFARTIAARLSGSRVEVLAPHGVQDLVNLIVRPTQAFAQKQSIYRARIASKDWARRWPGLHFIAA